MPIQIGQRPDHGFAEPLGLLSDCHRRIEHFLDVLQAIDQDAHGGPLATGPRADLDAALTYFATAAPKHTADEEESLFPRLRATTDPTAARALELLDHLAQEHDEAEQHHCAVDALGRRWLAVGRLDPVAAAALRAHLVALQTMYQQHIGLEDRELFPAAARLLSPAQLHAVGAEMAARRSKAAGR
ncbi:MAG: hemerythrin domain-containing protein [Vicinamibacterales bacterium]